MPETLAVFNEHGEPDNYIVQARFDLKGQEYIAIMSAKEIMDEIVFLRVEIDADGNTVYIRPLPCEELELVKKYESLENLMN